MIKDFIIEFEHKENEPITVLLLEDVIKKNGIDPVRYAIVERNENRYKLLVSGIKL